MLVTLGNCWILRNCIRQRCPTYQLHFPQNAENGHPKIRNRDGPGNSGKFRVSVEFPQIPLIRVIPGNSFCGPHFGDLGGFSGGNENVGDAPEQSKSRYV